MVVFRITQKEDCWSSCDPMKAAVCKYVSHILLQTKNHLCFFYLNFYNHAFYTVLNSSNHIYATFRDGENMAQGKCTLKLKCQPESQYCTCFASVICISPSSKVEGSISKEIRTSYNKLNS